MNLLEEYQLSTYQDYGPLQSKEHVRLVRNHLNGKIFIKKEMPADKKAIFEFLKEYPQKNIPQVEAYFIQDDKLIVVEEYIEGKSLEQLLQERTFDENECVEIIIQLCYALKPLHEANPPIVCRDLKAENIMVTNQGDIKIVDFNIARVYVQGKRRDTVLMGTAEYAAPEQFGYFQTDNRTDIYALGVLLNYMLSGKFPVEKIVSGKLASIVEKCISINPNGRYQTVEELAEKLAEVMGIDPKQSVIAAGPPVIVKKKKSFRLPGFRTGVPWKMCVAILGYIAMISLCYSLEITDKMNNELTNVGLRIEQTIFLLSQFAEVMLVFNYRGCRDKLPALGSLKKWVRILAYVGMEMLLMVTALLVCIFLEQLFLG